MSPLLCSQQVCWQATYTASLVQALRALRLSKGGPYQGGDVMIILV